MSSWTAVAKVAECPPGSAIEVVVDENVVALFNHSGEYHAVEGICAHQGGPLAKGQLENGVVTCPWHGWQYCVRTGRHMTNRTVALRRFNVRVDRDTILIGSTVQKDQGEVNNV